MAIRQVTTKRKIGSQNIVTRGMGPYQNLIRRGFYRTIFDEVVDTINVGGQSGTKRALRELEEIYVSAKLVRVNDERPRQDVSGFVKVGVNHESHYAVSLAEHLSTRVRSAWEMFKVTVKRIK